MSPCPFWQIDQTRVLVESEVGFALNDVYPLTKGHTLVVPRHRVESIFELSGKELALKRGEDSPSLVLALKIAALLVCPWTRSFR
jgi:hypothetical protein